MWGGSPAVALAGHTICGSHAGAGRDACAHRIRASDVAGKDRRHYRLATGLAGRAGGLWRGTPHLAGAPACHHATGFSSRGARIPGRTLGDTDALADAACPGRHGRTVLGRRPRTLRTVQRTRTAAAGYCLAVGVAD